jgi:predicted metal-dependent phosphotriesterase family hydrolase
MNRRKFLSLSGIGAAAYTAGITIPAFADAFGSSAGYIMTVNGKIKIENAGVFLPHEHIITDFTGAEKVAQPQYGRGVAFKKMLPYLQHAKKSGVNTMAECTPAYIGRDVKLLKQLAKASGLHIITNTGYYSASGFKYLPRHAYTESIEQLAARWLNEWKYGIDGTGIRPGFIKLGVDGGPLNEVQQKLIRAAAQVHLKSGLKIAIHNGNASAVNHELEILENEGVNANALIWVHAQNDNDGKTRLALAKKGCCISLDGVNETKESVENYCKAIQDLKQARLLNRVLLSHDDGFAVTKKEDGVLFEAYQNGNPVPYQSVFTLLKPALLKNGITRYEIDLIMVKNPANAFKIGVCPLI